MKKQITYLLIAFAVVLIGAVFYMGVLQKEVEESLLERIPASKRHLHVSPEGEVVEHTHTPIRPPAVEPKKDYPDPAAVKHPILRAWDTLDLNEIRRKYQPYTVQEMIEKWDDRYMDRPPEILAQRERYEIHYPKEQWLQRLYDNGFPFLDFGHYKMAFDTRARCVWSKDDFEDPEARTDRLDGYLLPPDATFEELEDVVVKFAIVARIKNQRARDADPSVFGGVTNIYGTFMPFSQDQVTVYAHISEEKLGSTFTGAMLSEEQQNDLTMYGVAPEGVRVIYTDEKGVPLPAGVVPRFYERKMAELEAAEAHVEQLLADHDVLFQTTPAPPHKDAPKATPSPSQPAHSHPHQDDGSELRDAGRRPVLPIDRHNIPVEMLPSEPPSRANMQQWFEVLQALHGGELPKDVRVLQSAIQELEAIRQAAADKQQAARQRPPERSAPKPPDAPE